MLKHSHPINTSLAFCCCILSYDFIINSPYYKIVRFKACYDNNFNDTKNKIISIRHSIHTWWWLGRALSNEIKISNSFSRRFNFCLIAVEELINESINWRRVEISVFSLICYINHQHYTHFLDIRWQFWIDYEANFTLYIF